MDGAVAVPSAEHTVQAPTVAADSAVAQQSPVIDLNGELVASFSARRGKPEDWLVAHGVDSMALQQWPGPVGVMSIEVVGKSGLYQPAEEGGGQPAFIHPVHADGPYSDIIDIIAWRPADPGTWWLRTGVAALLGGFALRCAWAHKWPLRLHRTPLSWLASDGNGAVVLDWAYCRSDLLDLAGLDAADYRHAEQIERALRVPPPPQPRIRIPQSVGAA